MSLAGSAGAVPSITGSDGDVWNAGSPEVRYVLTTEALSRQISWSLERSAPGAGGPFAARDGRGPSPVTVTLPGNAEGTFLITAPATSCSPSAEPSSSTGPRRRSASPGRPRGRG